MLIVPLPDGFGFDTVRRYLNDRPSDWSVIDHDPVLGPAAESEVAAVALDETVAASLWRRTGEAGQADSGYVMALVAATAKLDHALLEQVAGSQLIEPMAAEAQADFPVFELGALPPFAPLLNEGSRSGISVTVILDTQVAQGTGPFLCSGGDHRHSVLVEPPALAEDAVVARITSG